jgi:glutathionyl-hydroquinone reductase
MGELVEGIGTGVGSTQSSQRVHSRGLRRYSETGSSQTRAALPERACSKPRGRPIPSLRIACMSLAHRTLIMRNLKGLAGIVGISVVHWHMGDDGCTFDAGPDVIPDGINGGT